MAHSDNYPGAAAPIGKSDQPARKSDQEALAEKRAQNRARLGEGSLLAARCLPAMERMFDYSVAVNDQIAPDQEGLEVAATDLLHEAQFELRQRDLHQPLESQVAFELMNALSWARHALNEIYGKASSVKEVELRVSDGAPRGICYGSSFTLTLPFYLHLDRDEVHSHAFGCFAVFLDVAQTERHMWRKWCDDCKPSKSQAHRLWKRKLLNRYRERYLAP